jgi:hypothetical protein
MGVCPPAALLSHASVLLHLRKLDRCEGGIILHPDCIKQVCNGTLMLDCWPLFLLFMPLCMLPN